MFHQVSESSGSPLPFSGSQNFIAQSLGCRCMGRQVPGYSDGGGEGTYVPSLPPLPVSGFLDLSLPPCPAYRLVSASASKYLVPWLHVELPVSNVLCLHFDSQFRPPAQQTLLHLSLPTLLPLGGGSPTRLWVPRGQCMCLIYFCMNSGP